MAGIFDQAKNQSDDLIDSNPEKTKGAAKPASRKGGKKNRGKFGDKMEASKEKSTEMIDKATNKKD